MTTAMLVVAMQDAPGQVEQIARTFGVDWPHLFTQLVSFSIVCLLLYKLAYKPVLAMLEERRKQIATGLANAEKIKAELDRIEIQRQEILAKASAEGALLIEDARAAAARVEKQESQRAVASAEQIIAKAHEAAEQDRAQMLTELKREIGRLVVQTTAAVTGKVLTPDDHRRLADETARQLQA